VTLVYASTRHDSDQYNLALDCFMRTPLAQVYQANLSTDASLKTHQYIYGTPEAEDTKLSSVSGLAILLPNHKSNSS
jgi:hypothetical protein